MSIVVVTGAAGSLGTRVCRLLERDPTVRRVIGVDVVEQPKRSKAIWFRVDLRHDELEPVFRGADVVVHLASMFRPGAIGVDVAEIEVATAARTLDAASAAGVPRVVLVSSAMAYGAHPSNPVPIVEDAPLAPNPEYSFAVAKAEIEGLARRWADDNDGAEVVILRPTSALADRDLSWAVRGLRATSFVDIGDFDPPVQFVHLDDVASAVALAISGPLSGAYNVAPDGWLDGQTCRELAGFVPRVRVPEWVADELGRFGWRHGIAATPPGLTPYTVHPWVIANDRLRAAGWEPRYTNAEAYVEGTPPRPWASMNAKRRQQLALGAAGAVGSLAAAAVTYAVRASRRR